MEVQTGDLQGRMDLRYEQTVTIDGEDAKDLDDAISLTMEGDYTDWVAYRGCIKLCAGKFCT